MHELISRSIEAHGGLERWNQIGQVAATVAIGGVAFAQRGQEAFTRSPLRVIVDTQVQRTVFDPFLGSNKVAVYVPEETSVQSSYGAMLEKLRHPRASFAALPEGAHWSAPQLAYFAGYAMWMYLTVPFSLLAEGILFSEIDPVKDDGETWRALKATFPASYVTHSREQIFYFDDAGLIRRQDYALEIAHNVRAAHYLYDHQKVDGLVFPTRRRVYRRSPDNQPLKDLAVITADFSNFELRKTADTHPAPSLRTASIAS